MIAEDVPMMRMAAWGYLSSEVISRKEATQWREIGI